MKTLSVLLFILTLRETLSQLDKRSCEKGRTCIYSKTCKGQMTSSCRIATSYRMRGQWLDMELAGKMESNSQLYLSMAFSEGGKMNNSFVTECSTLIGEHGPSVKLSYNKRSTNVRIEGEEQLRPSVVLNASAVYEDGILYCSWTQALYPNVKNDQIFTYKNGSSYMILLAGGKMTEKEMKIHDFAEKTVRTNLTSGAKPIPSPGGISQGTLLKMTHGILMVIAWFVCIPLASIFARFMRSMSPDWKPCGMAVWFQVHRVSNLVGIALMVIGLILGVWAADWRWRGVGSDARPTLAAHTTVGIIALVLAWLQPFISLTRCGPQDERRPMFNWTHRSVGVLSFILAVVTIAIAANQLFSWPYRTAQTVFAILPVAIVIVMVVVVYFIERKRNEKGDNSRIDHVKMIVVIFGMSAFLGCAIVLCTLLAIPE